MKRKLINNNPEEVVRVLFRYYGLKYDGYAKHLHHSHPRYSHVESISYLFSRYGLDSALIETKSSEINKLPFPLIINYDGLFLPIAGVGEDGAFIILNEKGEREKIQLEATDKFWDHLALVFDKDEKGLGDLRREKLIWRFERCALFALCLIIATFMLYLSVKTVLQACWLRVFFLLSTFAGITISVLFHIQRLDRGNPFVNKICHASSDQTSKRDCTSILDSTASKFLGVISWVDFGSVYFVFFLVVIWTLPSQIATLLLAALSLLALAYVPYSIIYQAKIARHWCPLCLSVQAILFCNAVAALIYYLNEGVSFTGLFVDAAKVGGIAFVVISVYSVLINLVSSHITVKGRDKICREYLFSPSGIQSIIYGSPEADFASSSKIAVIDRGTNSELTMIINPLCSPCMRNTREILEMILRKRYTSLSIIFLIDPKAKPAIAHAAKLISAFMKGELLAALMQYVHRFPGVGGANGVFNEQAQAILDSQYAWCSNNGYTSTPKLFLNGHELPALFSIKDVDYLTE